jgi:hypothetical protein
MPAAWHQIWGSQIVSPLGGFRWRVGIGRIDAATAWALRSARAEHRAKPRHPQVCAWLDAGALTLGLGPQRSCRIYLGLLDADL